MKKRIFSLAVTLVLAVSLVIGATMFANAEETDGLKNTALNLAENVTIKMEVAIATPEDGAYAKITLPDGTVDTTQLVANAPKTAAGNYIFTAAVAAQDLASDVKIEICKADGTILVAEAATSALAYCNAYVSADANGEFVPLVNALVAYAEAAKYYFDANLNAEIGAATDLSSIADAKVEGKLPAGISHRSATLLLESETVIRHYFELKAGKNIADYTFFVDLDKDGKCDPMEKLAVNSKTGNNGTFYYVDIDGITPNELDEAYVLVVKDATDTYSCTYGALTYLKRTNDVNADNDTKNLISALYAYSAEAAMLKGTITYVTDGTEVASGEYEYGVTTPLVAVSTKANADFIGWFDAAGNKVSSITPNMIGNITLTAKFAATNELVIMDASEQSDSSRYFCLDHTADSDSNGICDKCGYCMDNASCTLKDFSATAACATCGKIGIVTGTETGLLFLNAHNYYLASSGSDLGYGYTKKVELNGKELLLFGKGNTFFNNAGTRINNTIVQGSSKVYAFEMEIGVPDETVYSQYELNPTANLDDKMASFYFRAKIDGASYKILFHSDNFAISNVNTAEKYSLIVDFSHLSDAEIGDGVADTAYFRVANEKGQILYTQALDFGRDVSAFAWATLGQFRMDGSGRILFGDFKEQMYNNYAISNDGSFLLEYTPGVETPLPEYNKAGYTFLGWYADPECTIPIDSIPANATGRFDVYAKAYKTLAAVDYKSYNEGFLINSADYCTGTNTDHVDANTDNACDDCGRCVKHIDTDENGICDKCTYSINACAAHSDKMTKDAQGNITKDALCDVCGKAEAECTAAEHEYVDVANAIADGKCDNCYRSMEYNPLNNRVEAHGPFNWGIGAEFSAGYSKIVANEGEDSYAQLAISGSGPAFNLTSSSSIAQYLPTEGSKILTYSFELMGEEGENVLPFLIRLRKTVGGNGFLNIIEIKSGVVFGYDGKAVAEINCENMTKFDVAVDFDRAELRYYVNGEYIRTAPITNAAYSNYANYGTGGYGLLQCRAQGSGVINIGSVGIYIGSAW